MKLFNHYTNFKHVWLDSRNWCLITPPSLKIPIMFNATPKDTMTIDHSNSKTFIALDLGTNNCRLLIANANRNGILSRQVHSKIVRLGESLFCSGRLSEVAIDRTLNVLKEFARIIESRTTAGMRFVATEACRVAKNGNSFKKRVKEVTGLTLEVISQETESKLMAMGCVSYCDRSFEHAIIVDIGGGSTEIVIVDLKFADCTTQRNLKNSIVYWMSIPIGVVTLADKLNGILITDSVYQETVEDILGRLNGIFEANPISSKIELSSVHMVGTSGTMTTLAGVYLGLKEYEMAKVDGVWLNSSQLKEMKRQVINLGEKELMENPFVGRERFDLVVPGCMILDAILKMWPCGNLRVTECGILEGIVFEMVN